ncbi:MAG: carbohydrate kinase family protein [Planctomycetota bacterium]|nr:MAG: carbohydrate kinase family protein [Planctomycetota bacterium]
MCARLGPHLHDYSLTVTLHPSNREDIARAAGAALRQAEMSQYRALVGFDGFIDVIIRVVDRRRTMAYEDFESIRTIGAFAERVARAAGRSANIELVTCDRRFGGNGPLLAGALGKLGLAVSYIGAVGADDAPTHLHPIYEPFAERCREVLPIAPPSVTEACEFEDGKLMFGHAQNATLVTWERICDLVGLDRLCAIVEASSLIGIVNWTMLGGVEGIWQGFIDHVFPVVSPRRRRMFIDLSDPAKRTDADLGRGLGLIAALQQHAEVTLGLNLAESQRIASVVGVEVPEGVEGSGRHDSVLRGAEEIRGSLGIDTVVIHRRDGAAAASAGADAAWFDGPFTRNPQLSTGAGDHFNAGFASAQVLGLELSACLAVACATSGLYVREAASPSAGRVASFLDALPAPEH